MLLIIPNQRHIKIACGSISKFVVPPSIYVDLVVAISWVKYSPVCAISVFYWWSVHLCLFISHASTKNRWHCAFIFDTFFCVLSSGKCGVDFLLGFSLQTASTFLLNTYFTFPLSCLSWLLVWETVFLPDFCLRKSNKSSATCHLCVADLRRSQAYVAVNGARGFSDEIFCHLPDGSSTSSDVGSEEPLVCAIDNSGQAAKKTRFGEYFKRFWSSFNRK